MNNLRGVKELTRKLSRMGKRMGLNALARATGKAATPTVRRIRARAPVGKRSHKTYKGRTVFPGFLKRSVRRRTRKNRQRGSVEVQIGVLSEAFYGVQFLDKGISVSARRTKKGKRSNTTKRFNRRAKSIKPYRIRGRRWFESTFVQQRSTIEANLTKELRKEVEKATRGA